LKYVCDIVVKKFTFAISSPDEFLSFLVHLDYNITSSLSDAVVDTVKTVSSRGHSVKYIPTL